MRHSIWLAGVRSISFLVLLCALVGCTSLPPKEEFLQLPENEKWSLAYDYMKETRRWAIGATIIGTAAGGVAGAALKGTVETGNGLATLSQGMK
jgi:hypothetical protein